MKKERIVRYSLDELPDGQFDRERVLGMTEEEIDAIANADPDNPPVSDEELAAGQLVWPEDRNKVPVYIRLDAEIVEHYKAGGPGYQTRINQDLLELVRHRQEAQEHAREKPRDAA